MVLEGLKRAECFVGLLRRLGYQREDGKLVKPEHFDQEFSSRQYGTVLGDLLAALQERILTDAEMARLEHLARLGLLDGLIDEEQPAAEGKNNVERQQDEEELRRLTELVRDYEEELSALEGQMKYLLEELAQETDLTINCPPISVPLDDAFKDTMAVLGDELFRDNLILNEQLGQLIADKLSALLRPIDTNSIEDPAYRFKSVRNEDLVERPWHPEDYAFYSTKIDKAIEVLKKEFNLDVQRSDLLQDELALADLRTTYQQAVFQNLCRFESERMALNQLLIAICQRYREAWGQVLQDTTPLQLKKLVDAVEDYLRDTSAPTVYHRSPTSSTRVKLADLDHRREQLAFELSTVGQIIRRLITGQGEINLISPPAASVEAQTRAISVELSTLLQSTLTESKQLELFIGGRV